MQLGVDTNAAVGVVLQGGIFREAGDGSLNLGNGSHRWAVVYAKTGSINTSDRNEKNTIADIDPEQAEKLIMGLKPSTFKFNDGTSGRTHWGLISQDIEELLPQIGMSDLDFAGFIKTPKTEDYYEDVPETVTDEETGEEKTVTRKELKTRTVEGEYVYALRYSEFISPLIYLIFCSTKSTTWSMSFPVVSISIAPSAFTSGANSLFESISSLLIISFIISSKVPSYPFSFNSI